METGSMEKTKPFNYKVEVRVVEDGLFDPRVYLSVTYDYKSSTGTHRVTIPKIYIPLENGFNIDSSEIYYGIDGYSPTIVLRDRYLLASRSDCTDSRGAKYENVCVIDEIIEPAKPKKMTVADIEKQLGYKIEIVSEEHD